MWQTVWYSSIHYCPQCAPVCHVNVETCHIRQPPGMLIAYLSLSCMWSCTTEYCLPFQSTAQLNIRRGWINCSQLCHSTIIAALPQSHPLHTYFPSKEISGAILNTIYMYDTYTRVRIPSETAQFFSLSAFGLCLTCLVLICIYMYEIDHVHNW